MTTWTTFASAHPALATAVRLRLTSHRHHILATLRTDGSPRVWGTEVVLHEGDLLLGSMVPAVKVADLMRDPRYALHTHPGDESMDGGDAKLAGIALPLGEEEGRSLSEALGTPGPCAWFRLDLREVVLTTVDPAADSMLVQSWNPEAGLRSWQRSGGGPAVPVN